MHLTLKPVIVIKYRIKPHLSLTHWGRVTHICVSRLTFIGSDNGLSPGRRQAIIWTNARILLIRTLGTNFSEILSEIHAFSFTKMHLKMSSGKWRPFCLGLNVLNTSICQISPDTSPHVVLLVCPTNSLLTDQAERLQERGLGPLVIGSKASNLSGSFKYCSYVILGSISLIFFHHNSNVTLSLTGWSLQFFAY